MIPKIIHYIWLGSLPKPDLVLKCIESWKKYCPDYEIKEWNDATTAHIENEYFRQAVEAKKWAFASDFLRLYAIRNEGGFYCDSDLEITRPIDEMCQYSFVTGYENFEGYYKPVTAFMGAEKGNEIIQELIKEYETQPFIVDGKPDLTTNTIRITRCFQQKYGIMPPFDGHDTTYLTDSSIIFPSYYFCTPEEGKINYTIHHFNGSWLIPKNYKRINILSIWHYRFAIFKHLFEQKEDEFPMRPQEKWLWKYRINKKYILGYLKKEKI